MDTGSDEYWIGVKSRLRTGQEVRGTVKRKAPYGLFVDIGEPMLGYVDIVEVSDGVIRGEQDMPDVGAVISAKVLGVDPARREIRLTLRSLIWPPFAYLNGQLIDAQAAAVPVTDAGFVLGVTVAEQLRTFGGKLFRLDRHLARLAHSLEIVGIDPAMPLEDIGRMAQELASRNHRLLDAADDLGLSIFVTPGPYTTFDTVAPRSGPTVGIHTYPLPFHLWHDKYAGGQSLVVTDVIQVPAECWPVELKCRSRMHYYLADKRAREIEPGARALLLDASGEVVEASTANVLIYRESEGLISPPREVILPGVSVATLEELAAKLAIPFGHRRIEISDVAGADEVLLCSTSPCVWPVTRFNGQPIADGRCGPIARRLLAAWSELVGVEIAVQASRFAARQSLPAV